MKKNVNLIILVVIGMLIYSCAEEVLPKPKGYLRLEYEEPAYDTIYTECSYRFEKNKLATLKRVSKIRYCWFNLEYPKQRATIYLSYYSIRNNLDSLLRDAQNLTQEHTKKADAIKPEEYINLERDVYGMIYNVTGNAASNTQFYVTDSVSNFITGSVYFKTRPNYDSILPASNYLRNDVIHLIETIQWKE